MAALSGAVTDIFELINLGSYVSNPAPNRSYTIVKPSQITTITISNNVSTTYV